MWLWVLTNDKIVITVMYIVLNLQKLYLFLSKISTLYLA